MEYLYQYRDKVNGHWISDAVDEQRILELVTRGTLTPYDFVRKVLHVGSVKEDDLYQYRDKANGHWISEPVNGKRIQELVTQGTLTSDDFVREVLHVGSVKEEDLYQYRDNNNHWISEPVDGKRIQELVTGRTLTSDDFLREAGQMIRNAFPEAEKHWAKLRRIRVQLNKLWDAQLDDIMAIISSGFHEKNPQRICEPWLEEFRNNFNPISFQTELKNIWHSGDISNFVKNELLYRQKVPKKPIEIDLSSVNFDHLEDQIYLDEKKKKLKLLLEEKGYNTNNNVSGIYAFYAKGNEKAIRVGQTDNLYKRLFADYPSESNPKTFREASRIEIYNINESIDGKDCLNAFEGLMIFKNGSPEKSFLPIYNYKQPPGSPIIEKALLKIGAEILQLQKTGP